MNRFEYVTPKTVDEAVAQLPEGRPKAGGTDLVALMKDRIIAPARLVNLLALDLRAIRLDKTLEVGALATLADVAAHPDIRKGFTALADAAGEAATPQVRNMATVGGNLCQRPRCWYFRSDQFTCAKKGGQGCPALEGDNRYHAIFDNATCAAVHASNLGPALLALDATVRIVGPKGERSLSAEKFFDAGGDVARENALAADELVTGVSVAAGWRSVYLEVRERQSFDWPLAAVAMATKDGTTRLALGGVAPRPWLCAGAKADDILKGATPLKHNAYKAKLVRTLLERAAEALR